MKRYKRTAGQRRYLALKRRADQARDKLESLQYFMVEASKKGEAVTQLSIMNTITQCSERLRG